MGTNSKARRAAKRRRQQARASRPSPEHAKDSGTPHDNSRDKDGHAEDSGTPSESSLDDAERAATLMSEALNALRFRPTLVAEQARRLTSEISGQRLAAMLRRLLMELTTAAVRSGWTPTDLGEITRRQLSPRHLPLVAALVAEETQRHPPTTISPSWQAELKDLGPADPLNLPDLSQVARALRLFCLLAELPALARSMPPPGSRQDTSRAIGKTESKMLARVRALLAKAESTDFPEESEALSAKAQELISTYALDQLALQADAGTADQPLTVQRMWIDAPYISAKSLLVHAVARANHCRSVFVDLGFVTLIGRSTDVDATELLVTSLLLQADRAMLLHHNQSSSPGPARTTSFRRSFLISYASRIGERLQGTAAESLATSGRSSELVPVLASVDDRVQAATEQLFPRLVRQEVRISNARGWAAGRAAADLAVFGVHGEISEEAAS